MLTYNKNLKLKRKQQIKNIVEHPYFGFIVIGVLLLLVQLIRLLGVNVPIQTLRAFGKTMIYTIVGLGFSILLGYGGLASLGTAGFVGLGAYILGYFTNALGFSVFLVIVMTIIFAVALGVVVGFISLRIEGMYLAIITLAIAQIINEVFKNWITFSNGADGMILNNRIVLFNQYITFDSNFIFVVISIVLVIVMILTYNIMKSPTGRALLAMRNSQSAAQAMGISIFKYRLLAFIVSTIYAMFAGILYLTYIPSTFPADWGLDFSLLVLAAVIVGGSRSIYGILLGTFLIFGLDLAVFSNNDYFGGWFVENSWVPTIVNGLLIILVIMFYRGGLIRLVNTLGAKIKGWYTKLKDKWRAYRYGTDSE
jgi:branched-chain amino acid transport system permease protein